MQYRNQVKDVFDYSKDIPAGIAGSAYDLLGADYLARDVASYYLENQTLREAIANYAALSVAIIGKIVNLNLVVQLNFSDNSVGFFALTGIDATGNLTLKFSSGIDADGNSIRPGTTNLSGSYLFTQGGYTGLEGFISGLQRLGLTIVRVGFEKGSTGSITDIELKCDATTGECRFVKSGG